MKWLVFVVFFSLLVGCTGNPGNTGSTDSSNNSANPRGSGSPRHETIQATNLPSQTREVRVLSSDQPKTKDLPKTAMNQQKIVLNVPVILQKPELKNGCEVTSLAMLLHAAGINVDKMELANKIKKDSDPLLQKHPGDVTHWGNPAHGFVGDITGKQRGYAVYHKPMEELLQSYMPGKALNLTYSSFDDLQHQIRNGKPVVVWTTVHFSPPKIWDTWQHGPEQIKATREEHAVLLVGYDDDHVYLNDPLSGKKAQPINKHSFLQSWDAMGKQALSYR